MTDPDVAALIQRAQGIAPSMHFCEWRGLAEQALALLAARLPTGQLQPIGDEWRDAINSARGLCESEANKWEKQAPGTSKHWRSVAIRLGALWLTSDHVGVAHVEDYNVLVAERDALRAEVAAQREALTRYARHLDTCAALGTQREWRATGRDGYWATPACNCGFAAVLSAAPEGEP